MREYIVWQIYENRLNWFGLQDSRYVPLEPDDKGIICSIVFPGLWLSVDALCQGDRAELLAVLQDGLQTAEHGAFVERLNKNAERSPHP